MSVIKIACVGDVMCGDHYTKPGWGIASNIDEYGVSFLPENIQELFKSHDIVVANIESVLSDNGRDDKKLRTLHMRGRAGTADMISKWGINVAHLANNHILEQGIEAARDTAVNLKNAGVIVIGAGPEKDFKNGVSAVRITSAGQEISLIGFCIHSGKYAFCPGTIDELIEKVGEEASLNRIVIVSIHWGAELIDRPDLWQLELSDRLSAAGATLVLGHHPHVFQGVDNRISSLTAYSMGNFIFDSELKLTEWTAILSVSIENRSIKEVELIPVKRGNGYRPFIAEGETAETINEKIKNRNNLIGMDIIDRDEFLVNYKREVKELDNLFRRHLHLYMLRNWFRYKWPFSFQLLLRPISRRLGTY